MTHTKLLLPHICHFNEAIKLGHPVRMEESVVFGFFLNTWVECGYFVMRLDRFIGGAEQTDLHSFRLFKSWMLGYNSGL